MAAAFSMVMLATTPSGDVHFAELESITKNAGFSRVELAPAARVSRLVIAYK
jgi:hypothetical protein